MSKLTDKRRVQVYAPTPQHWEEARKAAKRDGKSLSAWLVSLALRELPKKTRNKLEHGPR